jgi:hypothetical protein
MRDRYYLLACALLLIVPLSAQQESGSSSGFVFGASLQGSSNTLGTITKLDASAGYFFNRHWEVDLGVPYYFVSPSTSTTAATGAASVQGIGNAYAQVRFTLANPVVNYVATVTGTGPSGDRDKGLSTGHATVDWSNYFDKGFGRWTPFAEVGIANAVSDTTFFIRPYVTSGFVTHAQGGARFRFTRWMQAGAAGYVIEPGGKQTIVSRVVTTKSVGSGATLPAKLPNTPVTAVAKGLLNKPVFETTTITTGSASLARDNGLATWLVFGKSPGPNLQVGYTRSIEYDLDTLFFGIGFNIRKAVAVF